jgi:hypothetical protein
MRKFVMTAAAAALVLGATAFAANAQAQYPGAGSIHAQIKNASPIEKAACQGWGAHCPPGYVWSCGPWGCRCRPCR